MVHNDIHVCPSLDFTLPVTNSRQRRNNQKRALNVQFSVEVVEEGCGLDGFSKTHFVGQDAVLTTMVAIEQPIEAFELV